MSHCGVALCWGVRAAVGTVVLNAREDRRRLCPASFACFILRCYKVTTSFQISQRAEHRVAACCGEFFRLGSKRSVMPGVVTQRGVHGAADGQDVLVNQLDGTRSVGDLVVEVVGQSRSLQLQLLGLQGRLCRRLCGEGQTSDECIFLHRTC